MNPPSSSRLEVAGDLRAPLDALWGKSNAGGRPNLLVQHLLDTAAVGELVYDRHLSPAMCARLDDLVGGRGRSLLAWLCGVHDVGKATPAFQSQEPELARKVQAAGLPFPRLGPRAHRDWRHDHAGGKVVRDALRLAGWPDGQVAWVWPLIAGHHGEFPPKATLTSGTAEGRLHGRGEVWDRTQRGLVDLVTAAVGYGGLTDLAPSALPSRADQLALSGCIVMADWIASDERHFPGLDSLDQTGMRVARQRAETAWTALQLRGGWGAELVVPTGDVIGDRFGKVARPSQALVVDAARSLPAPGLLIVEAPMGEGKTEAALAAAEVLAARFGADGVFVGMPTQATSDPMFSRVQAWSAAVRPGLQVALLHGKRMVNPEWRELIARRPALAARPGADEYGCHDPYGATFVNVDEGGDHDRSDGSRAPAEWFLGRKRGLLAPLVVGTIDQLLFAATRTRHVMLRYAGLATKVVVLDEIHAADVYMVQFVDEALRWLGQGRVPVVLLSATLAPAQRRQLVAAYLQGALTDAHAAADDLPPTGGYPSVTAAWVEDGEPRHRVRSAASWRASQTVALEVLDEPPDDATGTVKDLLLRELRNGGCALVIRNTVGRAQDTFTALHAALGEDVVLLHGRLTAGHRADRTERILRLLGPPGEGRRPARLVVVATQLAEQSFDVDADLLVSDLAPVDLLLQRIGRLHRHERGAHDRPARLRHPRAVVTGLRRRGNMPPWFPGGSRAVYPEYHLLRAAALVVEGALGDGWSIPSDVPRLVAAAYDGGDVVPEVWAEDEASAHAKLAGDDERRIGAAEPYLLVRRGQWATPTLAGLHRERDRSAADEDRMRAVVRDGDPTVEVVLVHRDERGYRTLDGTWLGVNAESGRERPEKVLEDAVRLPAALTGPAQQLSTLPEWRDHPWLRSYRVLVLDGRGCGRVGDQDVRYDETLGLLTGAAGAPDLGGDDVQRQRTNG